MVRMVARLIAVALFALSLPLAVQAKTLYWISHGARVSLAVCHDRASKHRRIEERAAEASSWLRPARSRKSPASP